MQLSPRIQAEHIEQSLHNTVTTHRKLWRIIWAVVIIALLGAIVYFVYQFAEYGDAKAEQLLAEGSAHEAELEFTAALQAYATASDLAVVAPEQAAEAHYRSGQLYQSRGQLEEARRQFNDAVRLSAENANYAHAYLHVLIALRNLQTAEEFAEQVADRFSGDAQFVTTRADLALALSDIATAQQLFEQAIHIDETQARARMVRAVLTVHENPKDAAADLKAANLDTANEAMRGMHRSLSQLVGDLQQGLGNPAYERVLVAALLIEHNEFDLALVPLQSALEIDETYRDAWVYQAVAQLETGRLEQAEQSLDKAREIDPTFGFTRYVEGRLAETRGDMSAAASHFGAAVELAYDAVDAVIRQAKALVAIDDLDEAREVLSRAISSRGDAVLHQTLISIELAAGLSEQAYQDAQAYVDAFPVDLIANGLQALAAYDADKQPQADQLSATLLERDPLSAAGHLVQGLLNDDAAALTKARDLATAPYIADRANTALQAR